MKEITSIIEFVAEQHRLDRTGGLRRKDHGGEILPSDYPISASEKKFLEEQYKLFKSQFHS